MCGSTSVEARERIDHRALTVQFCGACVGTEFPAARHPHHDDARKHAENELRDNHGDEVADTVASLVSEYDPIDDVTHNTRQEYDERIDYALYECERDHVAIGDVRDFVCKHAFDFVFLHTLQKAGTDCDERAIASSAGRERVHVG